jgi:UPF0716 protein FxsA
MDGVLIIVGGAFLLAPGFITDVIGLVLLIPPSRALVRRVLARAIISRRFRFARTTTWSSGGPRGPEPPGPTAYPSPPPEKPRSPELPPG